MGFPSRAEYEAMIYNLPERYAGQVVVSTLRLYSTSALTAKLEGSVYFVNGLEMRVREFIDYRLGRILDYSYTVYRDEFKLRWYDPQPHPENQTLAETFPHHYHTEPDIKHNRLPAHGISFDAPNISRLIEDCLALS
jgi:hypothetical protein